LNGPSALAFDGNGNLFVANAGPGGTGTTVSEFAPDSTTPTATLTGLKGPRALAFDAHGNLFVANASGTTVSEFAAPLPIPAAGGVVVPTAQSVGVGTPSGTGLALSDAALAQLFTTGAVTIGGAAYTGSITVTGTVSRHPGYATLSLQTTKGSINTASGATLAVANLAVQAGSGIGTAAAALATDATHLAFTNQSGAIHISDTGAVTLTSVATLAGSSIPGNLTSLKVVGSVYTLLHSGGVSGQVSYQGQALAEGATLVLADGNHYQISYKANGGKDVTLTRIANPAPKSVTPPAQDRTVLDREADVARRLLTSGECRGAQPATTSSLFGLDADVLGRSLDRDSFDRSQAAAWRGLNGEEVAEGFPGSRQTQLELLDCYYADFLSPDGEVVGVAHWLDKLPSGRGSAAAVAQAFLGSDELHDWVVR
jgi:hypothetical protein